MRTTSAQLADVLVPALALLALGGAVTFFVWKALHEAPAVDSRRLAGPPAPPGGPKFMRAGPRRRKKDFPRFYKTREAFTRDDAEGYDLDVED